MARPEMGSHLEGSGVHRLLRGGRIRCDVSTQGAVTMVRVTAQQDLRKDPWNVASYIGGARGSCLHGASCSSLQAALGSLLAQGKVCLGFDSPINYP